MMGEAWTLGMQAQMTALASDGRSASQVASIMGLTRSAILGRANRTGVKFHGKRPTTGRPRKVREPREPKQKRAWQHTAEFRAALSARTKALWAPGGALREKMGGIPHEKRVQVMAAHLAGVSQPKAALAFGVSHEVIALWKRTRPDVVADARPLAEAALVNARAVKAEAARQRAAEKASVVMARAAYNAPLLEQLTGRHRLIVERFLDGATLQEVATPLGITRERVRQICVQAKLRFGVDFGERLQGSKGGYIPTGIGSGRTPRRSPSEPRVARVKGPDRRRKENANPATLEARSARMKAMWAAGNLARVNGGGFA